MRCCLFPLKPPLLQYEFGLHLVKPESFPAGKGVREDGKAGGICFVPSLLPVRVNFRFVCHLLSFLCSELVLVLRCRGPRQVSRTIRNRPPMCTLLSLSLTNLREQPFRNGWPRVPPAVYGVLWNKTRNLART